MAMAGPPSTAYKLTYSRRRFTDDDLQRLRRELPLRQDAYAYEEVDFSQNELSSAGLRVVLEVCRRCPKLRVLKLYRNQIDDGGAKGLAELCEQCPAIEEMHLSHNHFTAVGVEALVAAAAQARPDHMSPLWLRLEQNDVGDPDAVYRSLQSRLSVCNRQDEFRCTVRVCCRKMKVHLPFFNCQRASRYQSGSDKPSGSTPVGFKVPENAAIAGPSFRVPRGEASQGSPSVAQPRSATTTPKSNNGPASNGGCVWDVAGSGRRLSGSASPVSHSEGAETPADKSPAWGAAAACRSPATGNGSGTPSSSSKNGVGAAVEQPVASVPATSPTVKSTVTAVNGDVPGTAGSSEKTGEQARASIILDTHGQRRIAPKQLEAEDASNQFVCPLCSFVMVKPVITSCSHLFCDTCFRNWVGGQVSKMKKGMPGDGPVPLIPCPQPRCQTKLRKKDIMPMDKADTSKVGAVQLLQRLRNNLAVRCVHHCEHFKLPFGRDAERVAQQTGTTCKWVGDLMAYEVHIQKGCPVESHLRGTLADVVSKCGDRSEVATSAVPQGPPKASGTLPSTTGSPVKASFTQQGSAPQPPAKDGATASEQDEVRIARYDYNPRDTDNAQIVLKANDSVRIFEVTDSGWAAGVKLCKDTMQEVGEAGWFPAGYLFPPGHVVAK